MMFLPANRFEPYAEAVGDGLCDTSNAFKETALEVASKTGKHLRRAAAKIKDDGAWLEERFIDLVRDRPIACLACAMAVGALVTWMFTRPRRRRVRKGSPQARRIREERV